MFTKFKFVALAVVIGSSAFAAAGANAQSNSSFTSTSQAQTQSAAQGGALNYAPVTNESSTVRYATSSALAPALTSSNDTCMGATSLGATGMSFGVSLGSTWTDNNCKMLKNARELWNQGNHAAAMAMMCTDDDIRYAISVTGGVLDRRADGVLIHRGCPMAKADWIAAGKPLLDPVTGQPYTADQLNPPPKVAAVQVPSQPVVSVEPSGVVKTLAASKSATDIEAHAAIIQANADTAGHSVVNK
jgi:hypothetical protein